MTAQLDALAPVLAAEFEAHEVLHFEGRGGRTFDYIEDETVMDRADAVLGLGATSWSFTVITDACVRGSLDVRWPDGTASHYEDFGYASNNGPTSEPLKEAVSDAIRRLGRYIGIFRYGYHKHPSPGTGRAAPSPVRPAAPSRPVADDPYADLPEEPVFVGGVEDVCPDHELLWTLRPGGISKTTGKPYDPFWACPSQDRPFCKNKPSKEWQARHEG